MPYEPDDYLSRHFQTGSIDLAQQVAELARNATPPNSPNKALYQEMFMSVARMAQADRNRWDAKIMLQTLREMEMAFSLLEQFKRRRKVTVFGSARTPTDHPLYESVVEASRADYGPHRPVNIIDLGLIYTIDISPENEVRIVMTLTAPGCPVAGEMPGWVADAVEPIDGVKQVDVEMTFEPQWGMDMMSDEARLELGFM